MRHSSSITGALSSKHSPFHPCLNLISHNCFWNVQKYLSYITYTHTYTYTYTYCTLLIRMACLTPMMYNSLIFLWRVHIFVCLFIDKIRKPKVYTVHKYWYKPSIVQNGQLSFRNILTIFKVKCLIKFSILHNFINIPYSLFYDVNQFGK